jgi:hypothetical protein
MCPSLLWLPLPEEFPQYPPLLMAQIAPQAPLVVDIAPRWLLPPGRLAQIDVEASARCLYLCRIGVEGSSLANLLGKAGPPESPAPPLFLHLPPQLPPHPLPKAKKLLQTQRRVMMSLPVPGKNQNVIDTRLAFLYNKRPRTKGTFSHAQRSTSQYQVKMHSTQTTMSSL